MSQALDYSLARPDPAAIVAAGFVGVLRYVAPAQDAPKILTASEYASLRAAGLQVVLNWEWYANRAREGAAAGTADAQEALRQADALGYTGAIYFSVDYDAPESDQPAINDYFSACAQVVPLNRLGAYAGYWPLSRLFDSGLISYGWQTIAWSGNNREGRAHLFQTGATALGGDVNTILKENWTGQQMPKGINGMQLIQHPTQEMRLDIVYVDDQGNLHHRWTVDGGSQGLAGDSSSTGNESWGNPGRSLVPFSASGVWDAQGAYLNVLAATADGAQWVQARRADTGATAPGTWMQVSQSFAPAVGLTVAGEPLAEKIDAALKALAAGL